MNIAELFNLQEIWKCIYESAPIIDSKSAIEVGIPNKAANRAFNEVRIYREHSLLCLVCGSNPIIHECSYDAENDCQDFNYGIGEKHDVWCISCDGAEDGAKWLICVECKTYHKLCVCSNYSQMISFGGDFVRKNPSNDRDEVSIYHSDDECGYDLPEESNIKYLSRLIVFPTGYDGGYTHAWSCEYKDCAEYGKMYIYTDQ